MGSLKNDIRALDRAATELAAVPEPVSSKEYVIWGTPPSSHDDQLLYTKARTMEEAQRVMKVLENEHGVTRARIQVIDLSQDVDFGAMFASAVGGARSRRRTRSGR